MTYSALDLRKNIISSAYANNLIGLGVTHFKVETVMGFSLGNVYLSFSDFSCSGSGGSGSGGSGSGSGSSGSWSGGSPGAGEGNGGNGACCKSSYDRKGACTKGRCGSG